MLCTHSYFSLRYGTLSVKRLISEHIKAGYQTVCLTDINTTSACISFYAEAIKYKLKPVLGIDFRNGITQEFIGIAKNNEGFQELNSFLSSHLNKNIKIPERAPEFKNAFIIYPFSKKHLHNLRKNEYLGASHKDLGHIKFSALKQVLNKIVILQEVTFITKKDYNTHRLLRAISKNSLLSKLNKNEQASASNVLYAKNTLLELFDEFPEIIKNTNFILENASIGFELSKSAKDYLQPDFTGNNKNDFDLLKNLAYSGLRKRYANINQKISDRLRNELDMIQKKGFTSYFLINWDIVRYAQSKNYYHVGRGSGANSIVAYCLFITDVDPIELDLYFERFINLYRENPPDFDLDFSWKDRNDITAYIFAKYGLEHTALLATYNTFQYKSTIRELGKVFGLPKLEIDHLSNPNIDEKNLDEINSLVIKYSKYLEGFPNYLSVHAGGIVISKKSIYAYTATELPPKGFPITQFSMLEAEDIGFFKFDILSQRGLGHIKDTIELVKINQPKAQLQNIHNIEYFKNDNKIKSLLQNGKAMGCFYVESPAMRMLMSKLKVKTYLELVAASSIIRPGVAKSGMMQEYIKRHLYPERRKNVQQQLLNIMPETYGVMVYQEDVIKVAHFFAGLTLAEADVLRRGMSGKFRSREEFTKIKDRFFQNCKELGHQPELSEKIWFQIESFAGYSFSKGHSASYAVESFQSLYLKAYFPIEFMVGVINNFGGFYTTEYYLHEAKKYGAIIEAPCINKSKELTSLSAKTIYLGFIHIDSLEKNTIETILSTREAYGYFKNFEDFANKSKLGLEQIKLLIQIGAFRCFNKNKKELMWEAHFLFNKKRKSPLQATLFNAQTKKYQLPALHENELENAFDQIELLGFSLIDPFKLLKEPIYHTITANHLPQLKDKEVEIYAYLVTVKFTLTKNRERMYFGTFYDRCGNWIDTVHFPKSAIKYPFRGKGIYKIKGIVNEEFNFFSINVSKMEFMAIIQDPRYSENDKQKKRVELKRTNIQKEASPNVG